MKGPFDQLTVYKPDSMTEEDFDQWMRDRDFFSSVFGQPLRKVLFWTSEVTGQQFIVRGFK